MCVSADASPLVLHSDVFAAAPPGSGGVGPSDGGRHAAWRTTWEARV